MRYLVLILLMVSFVSSLEIDFDCPDEVFVDEEFECELEIFNGTGVYDVKVDLDGERNSALEIWDEDKDDWKSGYYYLKEFIEDEGKENILLRVSDYGNFDGVLKLRQGSKVEAFDFEMEVNKKKEKKVVEIKNETEVIKEVVLENTPSVIVLNKKIEKNESDGMVYLSKDGKVIDWLPYGFSLFMILVVAVLVWDKIEK